MTGSVDNTDFHHGQTTRHLSNTARMLCDEVESAFWQAVIRAVKSIRISTSGRVPTYAADENGH